MTHKILVLDRNDELAEHARTALEEFPTVEVISCTRIGSIDHMQEHEGPFSVLLAGPSLGTHAGMRRLAAIRRASPSMPIVMTFEQRPDATLREIVQVGAIDVLELPADEATLRHSIRQALDASDFLKRQHTIIQAAPVIDGVPAARAARVFTVCSATGGCGKTFYSTNMATYLARNGAGRVALIDLDLQFGEVSTALRLAPGYTIIEALSGDEGSGDLGARVEECMVQVEDNMFALAAPRDPAQADRVTPLEVTRIIEALRPRFDTIVVDTPTAMAETVLAAFDVSERLFVMATLDLPSIRNLGVFVQTLEKLRIPSENVSLLLNKIESDIGVDIDEVVKLFPQGFRARLPYAKEVSRSINMGTPVISAYPTSAVSRALNEALRELLPPSAVAASAQPVRRSGLLRMFRRRQHAVVSGGVA